MVVPGSAQSAVPGTGRSPSRFTSRPEGPAACRADARSRPRCPRAAARGRAGSSPAARGAHGDSGSRRGRGSAGRRPSRADGGRGACSPPLLVAFEKLLRALLRGTERLGPLVEELHAALGDRVRALPVAPLGADEAFLLERAQEAVEVAHLDPRLARQLGQPREEKVAVGLSLAEHEEECRIRPYGAGVRADGKIGIAEVLTSVNNESS